MAALTQTSMTGAGSRAATANTMTASDTFTWVQGSRQVLLLINASGGALTVTLTGSAAVSTVEAGGGTVAYNSGYSTGSIANNSKVAIPLDSLPGYMQGGTITATGGLNMTAYLLGY